MAFERCDDGVRGALAPEHAVFGRDGLAVDGLEAPESVHGHVLAGAGPGGRAVGSRYVLMAIDMQSAQRAQGDFLAGGAQCGDTVFVAQFAPGRKVDPIV
jgi:hypothetical protein